MVAKSRFNLWPNHTVASHNCCNDINLLTTTAKQKVIVLVIVLFIFFSNLFIVVVLKKLKTRSKILKEKLRNFNEKFSGL